ncbi:MAG: hypothetical protein EXR72_13845 [Myxococcales bacterium]|nr:hypothetical protein [Myxococcales bacterium]
MADIQPAGPQNLQPNPQQMRVTGLGTSAPCPKCGNTSTAPVGFTWWGGVLGPRIFHVVRCIGCGIQYNGKSGTSLGKPIAIYTGVALALGIAIAVMLGMAR